MAFVHGKSSIFKLDNASSVLTDISAFVNDCKLPAKADTADTSTFGKTAHTYIAGLKDAVITIAGLFDPTVDAILNSALGTATLKNFEYLPGGTGTGKVKYSGTVICDAYEVGGSVTSAVTFTASLKVSDAITRTIL